MSISRRDVLTAVLGGGVTATVATGSAEPPPAPDLSKFPKLEGKAKQVLGSVNSFVPPQAGESFRLDFATLGKAQTLEFDATRKSYIPLTHPTTVESTRYYSNGVFQNMRLVSPRNGRGRVVIDIVPQPGNGRNRVVVWVIVESDVFEGVAMIECEADGAFPHRQ